MPTSWLKNEIDFLNRQTKRKREKDKEMRGGVKKKFPVD